MDQQPGPDDAVSAAVGLLCCLGVAVALVVLIVRLVRRRGPAAPATATGSAPGHGYLSVLAVSVDAALREALAAAWAVPASASAAAHRAELVNRFAGALLGVESSWQHFGYGERDLTSLAEAQRSYLAAAADFASRVAAPADGGSLVVVVLVLATRSPALGVSTLTDARQLRDALAHRLRLPADELLGAEVFLGPPAGGFTEATLLARFPEVHRLEPGTYTS